MDMDTTQVTNKPLKNPVYKRTPALAVNKSIQNSKRKSKGHNQQFFHHLFFFPEMGPR